ncbi:RNA-directed DNA polymerase from mobile element jockey [Amphibalanus amphitrite]|uniref:RNA-directed DNA polymerase from mobile element jockey n=1 Tax=Amphibalanus amphitrite TaxID=1232801 RepID=A0A6A4VQ85_AMPAM|nr:RNA-directed DNA polymerase from mobile element jockey [Amphibalanus amphitrite]
MAVHAGPPCRPPVLLLLLLLLLRQPRPTHGARVSTASASALPIGMYADDLIIYASDSSVPTAQAKVQAAMDEVEEWANAWNMTISATKTKTVLFTSNVHEVNSKKKVDICLGDTTIQQTSEVTVLGVVFDTCLSPNMYSS